jgi:succinate dehydrogenase / fumarate reductase, membrane anchor subunit
MYEENSMTTHVISKPQGVWAWILQRLTAVLLLVFLGTHLAVLHYIPANMEINSLGVAVRLKSALYFIVDSGLLVTGLYHGLNGVRNVLFDFIVADGVRHWLNLALVVIGVAFTLWGAYALWIFVQ